MKNSIFKDLIADTRIPGTFWNYVAVSIVFHILMLYLLFTVRFEAPGINQTVSVRGGANSTAGVPTAQESQPVSAIQGRETGYGSDTNEDREIISPSSTEFANSAAGGNVITPQTTYVYPHAMRRNPLHYNMDQNVKLYVKPFIDAKKQSVSRLPVQPLPTTARDNSSFQKVKRSIERKQIPPKELVKIEELINYFNYQYPLPKAPHPFSITTELAQCPWMREHLLLHIGLQGSIRDRDINEGREVIAEDLWLKVTFNSQQIKAYSLIGYSRQKPRLGQANDRWPSGSTLYIGQSFTSLYELIPLAIKKDRESPEKTARVTVRYKEPGGTEVKQISQDVYPVKDKEKEPSQSFRFSAVVAQFGLFLQNPGLTEVSAILTLLDAARDALGEDKNGYRAEFIKMLQNYKKLLENNHADQN